MAKLSGGEYSRPREPKNPLPPQKGKARGRPAAVESWLPPDWVVEGKVRRSGVAAGQIDKYYTDPVSGRKFRSKKEVLNFLETGAVPQRKRGTAIASVVKDSFDDVSPVKNFKKSMTTTKTKTFERKKGINNAVVVKESFDDLSAVKKLKKSLTTTNTKTSKFDFFDVPEKIKWVFSPDTDMAYWTPFTGNEMVAESVAQEWVAAAIDVMGGKCR